MGCHIVALEEDKELFFALLVPMVHFPAASFIPQPQVLKILTLWRLFQPRLRRDVLVSKFALLVNEFCGIHLFMNFNF
jgi:hypothetical protein